MCFLSDDNNFKTEGASDKHKLQFNGIIVCENGWCKNEKRNIGIRLLNIA